MPEGITISGGGGAEGGDGGGGGGGRGGGRGGGDGANCELLVKSRRTAPPSVTTSFFSLLHRQAKTLTVMPSMTLGSKSFFSAIF